VPAAARGDPPQLFWTLNALGGHDDQILAESERLGVVAPVSDGYATGVSSMVLQWQSARRVNRIDLRFDLAATGYGTKIIGGDSELGLTAAYRQALPRGLAVDASLARWWFRRDVEAAGEPVFDYDLGRLDLRLGMPMGTAWFMTLGAQRNWFTFPGRSLEAGGEQERQNQIILSLVLGRALGRRSNLTGSILLRDTSSNVALAEFQGPGLWLKGQVGLTRSWSLTFYGAYIRRNYSTAPVYETRGGETVATEELRADDAWQGGAALQRVLDDRLILFLQGTFLHQSSRDPAFSYDQSRIGVGLEFALLRGRSGSPVTRLLPLPPEPTLLPRKVDGGILFRYRDPAAGSVSVVGGFNGWDPGRSPLSGPDGEGVWEGVVAIPPGRWRFSFVVDGEWVPPPEAVLFEDDGFGGRHGILDVAP
jgi:hypothetical protein